MISSLIPTLIAATVAAPNDGAAILEAAHGLRVRGASFAADRGFAALGREAPSSFEGHLAWARFLLEEGRADQALGPAGVASRLEPYDAAAYAVRAEARIRSGQGDTGRALLDKALEMDPWSPDALLALAELLREGGEAKAEADVLRRAVEVAGEDLRVMQAAAIAAMHRADEAEAGRLVGRMAASGGGVVATLLVAQTYLMAQRPHEALRVLQAALPAHGAQPRLLRALGRSLLAAGASPLRAAAAFQQALAADPDDVDAAVGFARSLTALLPSDDNGVRELAMRTLGDVLNREPGHVGALLAQADLARALGDGPGAATFLVKVPETHPARDEADNVRGLIRLDREDPYGAIGIFREVLGRRPDLRHVRLNLALAMIKAGRSTDAKKEASAAVSGLPKGHPLVGYAASLGVAR